MQPNIFLFDFETTGLKPGYHDAIQVAALLVTPDLQEVSAFESLIRPTNPQNASPEALDVHKKPMSQLMAAPTPHEVMTLLQEGARLAGVPYVAGFNVGFDLKFLAALEGATGIRIERQASPILCAREIYLRAKGLSLYTKGTKLTDLCRLYGIETDGAHDALADVRMTLKLLQVLRREHPEAFAFLEVPVEVPAVVESVPIPSEVLAAFAGTAEAELKKRVTDLLTKIREADAAAASAQRVVAATPEGQALAALQSQAASYRAELQDLLKEAPVVETPAGKAGYQERRSITYRPSAVRELAGQAIAMLCVKETVDATALKAHVKAGIKAGTVAPDLLEQIEARADVKVVKAFICQPQAPAEPEAVASAPVAVQEAFGF